MNRLRLCFIGRADSIHTRRWVEPFVERGDEVWLINVAAQPAQDPWDGVHLIDLPTICNVSWLRYAVWSVYTWVAVRRIRPDILHAHCLDLSGWVAAAASYHPLVVTVWGSDILLHPQQSRMARKLAHWVLGKADRVTAPAQPLFDQAVAFAGDADKVRLIYWGIDCRTFQPQDDTTTLRASLGLPPKAPIIFCPRALRPVYDIETVLRAFKRVLDDLPEAILLLLEFNAYSDYRQKIDGWIREWDLGGRVRFLPPIHDQADLAALYRLASLVVSLPLSDSLSLTVQEAMACGTPVVVSDLPAYKNWIVNGETGFVVPVRDANAAAEAILSLLSLDEKERAEIGQRSRKLVCQEASLEQQKESAIELYRDLLSLHAGQSTPGSAGTKEIEESQAVWE